MPPVCRDRNGCHRAPTRRRATEAATGRRKHVLVSSERTKSNALVTERDKLIGALAAYRSALRSGEHESEKLRQEGDAALAPHMQRLASSAATETEPDGG